MRNVRIFFEKKGLAKYISHLDLMRCFSRAIKRAGIPLWYTEGFNPHPFMTFSLPLSLGFQSVCESVDIRIVGEMEDGEIKERLNKAIPNGIVITEVSQPVHKADEIRFAQFDILLLTDKINEVEKSVSSKIQSDEIIVEKKGKQGRKKVVKQINIKENIISYSVSEDKSGVRIKVVLTAGLNNNINPSLLIDAICCDVNDFIDSSEVIKEKMFLEDMTEFC